MAGVRLSLVMPAYNESAGIEVAVREASAVLATFAGEFEVVVVDDGSRDGTGATVAGLTRELPGLRLVRHATNRGYGAALRTGFESARFDRVAFTDADAQFDLTDLGRLAALTDQYPVVVGYRMNRQDPWRRRFLSWGYNRLARTMLGTRVRDCDCALKVFRREALERLMPRSTNFFVNTEMLTLARRYDIPVVEVGVRHRPRRHGTSTVSLRDVPRTLRTFLPFWWSQLFNGAARV